jgi:ATP-dependent DNA helicase RecG
MKANGSPPPEFESNEGRTSFLIRLPVHERAERLAAADANGGATAPTPGKLGPSRDQVEILRKCSEDRPLVDLMDVTGRSNRTKFRDQVLSPLLKAGLIEMTIPDKPRSSAQRYRLTTLGHDLVAGLAERGGHHEDR